MNSGIIFAKDKVKDKERDKVTDGMKRIDHMGE